MKSINAAYEQIQKDRRAGRTSYGTGGYNTGYNGGTYGGNGGYNTGYNGGSYGGYNTGYNTGYGNGQSYNGGTGGSYNYGTSRFADIRRLISQNRIAEAEELLDGVPEYNRNAEWYFLKGSIFYRRGWLNEAARCYQRAYHMEPGNREYAAAYSRISYQQENGSSPGRTTQAGVCGCDCCDCCAGMMCLDCLCRGC